MKTNFKKTLTFSFAFAILANYAISPSTYFDVLTAKAAEDKVQKNEINDAFTSSSPITIEDVKAIQAFCSASDYVGPGNAIDLNNDFRVDIFDLIIARRELITNALPSLIDFSADTYDIYINEVEDVTFTLSVTEISPLEENAISIYDNNDVFVAYMHDDGINGDEVAQDGIYTSIVPLSSTEIETKDYYAATDNVKSNSFEICFYKDLEEDDFKNFWILYSHISELPFDEACEYIMASDEIKSYSINEERKTISYQSVYGIFGCWEEAEDVSNSVNKGGGTFAVPSRNGIDYDEVENKLSSVNIKAAHPNKKDIIVLRPFRSTEFQYDDFKIAGNLLSKALDSNVKVVDDEDVTIEQMKDLSSYGTVLIDSHGTLNDDDTPYMLIGEELDEEKFLWDVGYYLKHVGYSADYLSGRIYCTSFSSGDTVFHRLSVGGKFFKKYYSKNSLKESFWFLGTCYSMHDNSIANALIDKGAEAVVGFTNPVSVIYCNSTLFETVLNSMILSAYNVSKSVGEAKWNYGLTDPHNPETTIKMKGKTNFNLINSITSNTFYNNGHTYQVFDQSMTWTQAEAYCEQLGGHLVTINSEDEELYVESLIDQFSKYHYFIGLREEGRYNYCWVTGEKFDYNKNVAGADGEYNQIHYMVTSINMGEPYIHVWADHDDFIRGDRWDYTNSGFVCEWDTIIK